MNVSKGTLYFDALDMNCVHKNEKHMAQFLYPNICNISLKFKDASVCHVTNLKFLLVTVIDWCDKNHY